MQIAADRASAPGPSAVTSRRGDADERAPPNRTLPLTDAATGQAVAATLAASPSDPPARRKDDADTLRGAL